MSAWMPEFYRCAVNKGKKLSRKFVKDEGIKTVWRFLQAIEDKGSSCKDGRLSLQGKFTKLPGDMAKKYYELITHLE